MKRGPLPTVVELCPGGEEVILPAARPALGPHVSLDYGYESAPLGLIDVLLPDPPDAEPLDVLAPWSYP